MSERRYIVGEKIDLSVLPNHVYDVPEGTSGYMRFFGDAVTASGEISAFAIEAYNTTTSETDTLESGVSYESRPIPIGGYRDFNETDFFAENYENQKVKQVMYNGEPRHIPVFAFLVLDDAIYITERIDKVTIDGSAEIKFDTAYPVYAIKSLDGEEYTATLRGGLESEDVAGKYFTADNNGYTIIHNPCYAKSLYIEGTGDVRVWAGTDAALCPFV